MIATAHLFLSLVPINSRPGYLTHVLEDEQAENLSCWTEATLLRYQSCGCKGCAAMAIKVIMV